MLITCKECGLPVSDKAISCPHCGIPMKEEKKSSKRNTPRRMRLPNGFGQITELKNKNLRKPFRVMITVGKTREGKPISKILKPEGYFATYNEAYMALVEYNKNPYELDECITVRELYEIWIEEYKKKLKSTSSIRTITSAWAYCSSIENINVRQLRPHHIKAAMDTCESKNTQNRIKSVFNLMLDFALERDLVDKNYARTFKVEAAETNNNHISFTEEEMNILWENISIPFVNYILIECYTGWRPQELCNLLLKNINLNDETMIGGMKTEAGTDRIVPIHSKILPLVKKMYMLASNMNAKTLVIDMDGKSMTYDRYYKAFKRVLADLSIGNTHRPHDCRKQFITMAKNANMDEYAIKKIVGHEIDDITEKIYTDRDPEWLKNEMKKI